MAYPAVQVVTLTDALFSKKHGKGTKSIGYHSRLNKHSSPTRPSTSTRPLVWNNRIPMKSSPYIGYLRHAPSRKYQKKNIRFRSMSNSMSMRVSASSVDRLSDSFLFEKSSPYVGFMRHAPPSHFKRRTGTGSRIKLKSHSSCHDDRDHPAMQEHERDENSAFCNIPSSSSSSSSTDTLLFLRYPKHSQYISGRLPGGNPLDSYCSMCKWFTETEKSSQHHHYPYHEYDTVEVFHNLASWFLFPIAYDERTVCTFCDMKYDAYMEHVSRGLAFFSSFVKRMIPGRDALFICTGLQMDGNSLPLGPASSVNGIPDGDSSLSRSTTIIEATTTNENDDSGKNIDPVPLPSNHPLHVSVSSLAKAYHSEQARSDILNVYSSEDIVAMSSEEIQRHLDIESILRLPTITYRSKNKPQSNQQMQQEKEEGIAITEGSGSGSNVTSDNQTDNRSNTLEWSWIAVPQDPSKCEQEEHASKMEQNDFHLGEIMNNGEKETNNNNNKICQSQDEHCVICLEQFKDGDRLRVLPCKHLFHTSCIDKWLSGASSDEECFTGSCPTCKKTPNIGVMSNNSSFDVGEDDSMGTMGEDMRVEGIVPSWAFARLGDSIAMEK